MGLFYYFIYWGRAALDALIAVIISIIYSNSLNMPNHSIPVLDDEVNITQFSVFVLVMIWINIKVSVESGMKNLKTVKYIHFTVFLTLLAFFLFCFQSWFHLPPNFPLFIISSTIGYILFTIILDKLIAKSSKISKNTLKLHIE